MSAYDLFILFLQLLAVGSIASLFGSVFVSFYLRAPRGTLRRKVAQRLWIWGL